MRLKISLPVLIMLAGSSLSPARAATTADYAPAWTLTGLGGYAWYSNRTFFPLDSLADAPVFGARIGCALGEYWSLEAAGSYASTRGIHRDGSDGPDVKVMNASASLLAQLTPMSAWGAPYMGAGFGYNQYDSDAAGDNLHYGVLELALGWKKAMGEHLSLRIEGRNLLNLPNENLASANKADQQVWAGFTLGFGGTPRDADSDGVADKRDKCPGTPAGATVTADGCPTDGDGDGVWDGLDRCANTPRGATVDAAGCPSDSDGDGVPDGIDACAATPKGATVDAKGCPGDSDGDAVWNGLDQCPNTPTGATVDANGCPSDSDVDGVPDGIDLCPNTATGLKVDVVGCPIEVTEKETQLLDTGLIRLQNVNFETGKSALLPESFAALDEVGSILVKWPQLQIEIGGHTDSRGSAGRNQLLSEDRAKAVQEYLAGKFASLDAGQLTAKGYGATAPIAKNTSALNMAKNRRVEFKVLNREALKKEIERRRMLQK